MHEADDAALNNIERFVHDQERDPEDSGQNLGDDVSMNVCQAAVDPVVADGQTFVVDAEKVENRRVEVVTIRCSLGGVPRPVVAPACPFGKAA